MTGRIPSQTNSSLPPVRRQFHSSSRRPPMNSNNTSTSNTTQSTVHTDASASSEDIIIRDETGNFRLDVPNMAPLPRDEAKDEKEVENRLIESYRKHQQHIDSNGSPPPSPSTPTFKKEELPSPSPAKKRKIRFPLSLVMREKATQPASANIPSQAFDKTCVFCLHPKKPSPNELEKLSANPEDTNYSPWAELRTSLQASLQSKLASLDEDKWMFGEDDDVPF